ncbi:putative 21s rrna (uridine2o)-methyltransferase mrm2 [Phaeomoniella chlamydospora]|uniref:rRNA methyltransferase 2, mitochondrial n=1 Tax=Phaeomoniella chlamydospora TaxID=158046 RepID=A0A0G2F0I8_PHACM|nr:putative 21s rrna (uridine2o)-methyltransferase mrm2 [Phaeomoniella chlamydospora]
MVVTSEGEVIEREEQQDQHLGVTNVKEEPGESYIDRERRETAHDDIQEADMNDAMEDMKKDRMVDIVLSDIGNNFRDHAGSMDLCRAALDFSFDVLKFGGHFVCKFYQGAEDKALELQLKKLFAKVHREKPESSRSESKESYFVAIRRLPNARKEDVFPAET